MVALTLAAPASAFEPLGEIGAGDGGGAGQIDPSTLAIAANGDLYIGENDNHRISQFEADGTFIRAWGHDVVPGGGTGFEVCTTATGCKAGVSGGNAGQLDGPQGMAIDAGGNLYVSDFYAQRINQFTQDGVFIRAWGHDVIPGDGEGFEVCTTATGCQEGDLGGDAGQFYSPEGLAIGPDGHIFTADLNNKRIDEFTPSAEFVRAWGFDVSPAGGTGFEICTTATGCKAGVEGNAAGQLFFARDVAVDTAGHIFVSSINRVNEYAPGGTFVRAWGFDVNPAGGTGFEICTTATGCKAAIGGPGPGQLQAVYRLTSAASGDIYVSDAGTKRINQYTGAAFSRAWGFDVVPGGGTGFEVCTGAIGCQSGLAGSGPGQLSFPFEIAVDCRSAVWVTDITNKRVVRYGEPGTPLPPSCVDPPAGPAGEPSNRFRFGKLKRNSRKGTATLTVILPGPGTLVLKGKGVKRVRKAVKAAGKVKLPIRAVGKAKKKLNSEGRAKVRAKVTFTPTGGEPRTKSRKLTLRKAVG